MASGPFPTLSTRNFKVVVLVLAVLVLWFWFDVPDYSRLEDLKRTHQHHSLELRALRAVADAEQQAQTGTHAVCSQHAIERMRYIDWYNSSLPHLGGWEPWSPLIPPRGMHERVDFNARIPMPGVQYRAKEQIAFLRRACGQLPRSEYSYLTENWHVTPQAPIRYHPMNTQFGPVDASLLYCLVRHFKPRRVVEVGAGSSTNVLVTAFRANARDGHPVNFTSVEPFPSEHAITIAREFGTLLAARAEEVPKAVWAQLEPGDILFIDSSHLLRLDSEIVPVFLRILPALPAGVIIHVHDIYLPTPYPSKFYSQRWFWNEEFALQGLLYESSVFKVVVANHYLWSFLDRKDVYSEVMPPAAAKQIHLDQVARNPNVKNKKKARFPVPSSFYMVKRR
eukprot:TRINITY_DN58048_c0_g1_i1.p1 TRINITY_DN58048_c0_g1~~TRINITY_DN58048_c0_g1_i1.p1  ORF type:complete len:394 (+),score=68.58 TRINITY_DN58048_c0_g1_i1:144-1325(+)